MTVLPVSFCSDSVWDPSPRLCVLKREEEESYGFHLRVEKGCHGHIIRNVVLGGVAARSSLQDGDRLLEVNNCYVVDAPHPEVTSISVIITRKEVCVSLFLKKVAKKIALSGQQLCLLVLDGKEYEQAVSRGQDFCDLVRAHKGEGLKPPRLCHIAKNHVSGLGISFTPVEGNSSH